MQHTTEGAALLGGFPAGSSPVTPSRWTEVSYTDFGLVKGVALWEQ